LVVVFVVLAGKPAKAASTKLIAVAVMDLKPQGVSPGLAGTVAGLVVSELRRLGLFQVTSMADVRALIQFQTDRRMAGCEADVACVAEIGGALGVAYTVAGTVGRLGELHVVDLTLTDIKRAKVIASARAEAAGTGPAMLAEVGRCVRRLTRSLRRGKSGYLLLHANEEGATVSLDGEMIGVTPLPLTRVPGGRHDVELNKPSFVRWAREVQVVPEESTQLQAVLVPSPEFAARHRRRERVRRGLAWGLTATALVAAGGGTWMYLKASDESTRSEDLHAELLDHPNDRAVYSELLEVNERGRKYVTTYWVLAALGVASAGTAAALFGTAEDPDRYEVLDATQEEEPAPGAQPGTEGKPDPPDAPDPGSGASGSSTRSRPPGRPWWQRVAIGGGVDQEGPWILLGGSF